MGIQDLSKRALSTKLTEACEQYQAKFGKKAKHCLMNSQDAKDIVWKKRTPKIAGRSYIQRNVFYIGEAPY